MAGQRQPISLIEHKGKAHFTKAQIEERKRNEVQADTDNIVPPDYLTKKQAKEFNRWAEELKRCEIMTNLDCEALARYVIASEKWVEYVKLRKSVPKNVESLTLLEKADKLERGAFADSDRAAKALGLDISSRCKLIVPKANDEPKPNKFTGTGTYGR